MRFFSTVSKYAFRLIECIAGDGYLGLCTGQKMMYGVSWA